MCPADEGRSFALCWKIQRQHGLTTVILDGELDLASVDAVQELFESLVAEGSVVVADLEKLDFIDSTGVRVLGRAHQAAQRAGRRFLLGRVSPAVRRVLHVAGLVDFFEYVEGSPPDETLCRVCDTWVPRASGRCINCGSAL